MSRNCSSMPTQKQRTVFAWIAQQDLTICEGRWYASSVTEKKVAEIGVSKNLMAKAVNPRKFAAFSFRAPLWRLDGRSASSAGSRMRFPVRQSCRAAAPIGVVTAVFKLNLMRPFMANHTQTSSTPDDLRLTQSEIEFIQRCRCLRDPFPGMLFKQMGFLLKDPKNRRVQPPALRVISGQSRPSKKRAAKLSLVKEA